MESPRRYVRPVVHHAIIICRTDTRPRWGGVTAQTLAARIISGRLPCVVVSYFLIVSQWIVFRYASPLPRLPRAGRMTHKDGGRPRLRRVPFAVLGGAWMRRPSRRDAQARQRDGYREDAPARPHLRHSIDGGGGQERPAGAALCANS